MRPTVERLGEEALLLRLGDGIDLATNARVHACASRLRADAPAWVRDVVPAYATLAVFVDLDWLPGADDPLAVAAEWLAARADGGDAPAETRQPADPREVPVRFGAGDGPDLADVASAAGLSQADAIARFCAPTYQVAMLGFAPGFPYLVGLDPALAMPRLATPRTRVPAGSVAIGGMQAGIYPREGPGGWRLLGRTPLALFEPARDAPAWLLPGDRVRFVAVP